MLNAQIRRNLQQNQLSETRAMRPQLFISQAEVNPPARDPQDVFVPRDPTLDQPVEQQRSV